jgi:AI-2 transport system permease protein
MTILIVLVVAVGFVNPNFLKPTSLMFVVNSSLVLVLVTVGEIFVLLTRGIDVSVGAILGISAVVLGTVLVSGGSLLSAILSALVTGAVAGSINGIGVAYFRVPPIIMTLGTLGVYRGLMRVITEGSWIENIPTNIKNLASAEFMGVRVFIYFVFIVVVLVAILLKRIRIARYFYTVGDNEDGAYLMGVPVKLTIFLSYVFAGFFAGLASIIFVAQIAFVPMQAGQGLELRAIASCVLGGVSLSGGVGTPYGALLGGLFLTVIDSVLVYLKLPSHWNNAVAGLILLAVVVLDYRIRVSVDDYQRRLRSRFRFAEKGTGVSMESTYVEDITK